MAEFPYLIAIGLIEQDGKRAMPLGGKSLPNSIDIEEAPDDKAKPIALELLLRVLQRTEQGPLKRIAGDKSLLIVEMPIEAMQSKLSLLKANWLRNGNTDKFISEMNEISCSIWFVNFVRYEGVKFLRYESKN
tara:strand:- start:920 stop:1318 length:399 start_codon:yes stop_codon:yes gene_type:complete